MGEDLERKRRRNEKRLRDIALQRNLMERNLFSSTPEIFTTHYRCESGKNSAFLKDGDPLLIRDNSRGRVEVLKSGLSVGFMEKEDAAGLRALLAKERRASGMCLGEVVKAPNEGKSFRVRVRPINPDGAKNDGACKAE